MTTKFTAIALVLATTLIASTSFAESTRRQVEAERVQVVRSGDVMVNGDVGLKLNELYPERYPAKQVQAGLSREQVKADLANALRTGDYVANGEIGDKCNELHPNMHQGS